MCGKHLQSDDCSYMFYMLLFMSYLLTNHMLHHINRRIYA